MTLEESNPIDKICGKCQKRKLLSDFDFSDDAKDGRVANCKECGRSESEFCCDGPGHTVGCVSYKMFMAIYWELDCLLARVQNGLPLPSETFKGYNRTERD